MRVQKATTPSLVSGSGACLPACRVILQLFHGSYNIHHHLFPRRLKTHTRVRLPTNLTNNKWSWVSVLKRVLFVMRGLKGSDVILETSRGFLPLIKLAEMVVCHCLQIVRLCCHLVVLHMTQDSVCLMSQALYAISTAAQFLSNILWGRQGDSSAHLQCLQVFSGLVQRIQNSFRIFENCNSKTVKWGEVTKERTVSIVLTSVTGLASSI